MYDDMRVEGPICDDMRVDIPICDDMRLLTISMYESLSLCVGSGNIGRLSETSAVWITV
jgi:hypothetical protein